MLAVVLVAALTVFFLVGAGKAVDRLSLAKGQIEKSTEMPFENSNLAGRNLRTIAAIEPPAPDAVIREVVVQDVDTEFPTSVAAAEVGFVPSQNAMANISPSSPLLHSPEKRRITPHNAEIPEEVSPGPVYQGEVDLVDLPADVFIKLLRSRSDRVIYYTVRAGDTLSYIFDSLRMHSLLSPLYNQRKSILKPLGNLYPGRLMEIGIGDSGLSYLLYHKESVQHFLFYRVQDGNPPPYRIARLDLSVQARSASAANVIRENFYLSAKEVGLDDHIIGTVVNLLRWDIDFAHDVMPGSYFSLVYRDKFANGKRVGSSEILGIQFVIYPSRVVTVLRHTDANGQVGYFDPKGRNVRRQFLRQPIAGDRSYISSRFNLRRKHPILHRIRAHKGVDFAAPAGTSIRAVGSGELTFSGWKGGYGRTVIIAHGSGYSTLYAHMLRYGKFRRGSRVKQGDIIGFVGSSGSATGSHLHYEFRIGGVHKDPERIASPGVGILDKSELAVFRSEMLPVLADLEQLTLPLASAKY